VIHVFGWVKMAGFEGSNPDQPAGFYSIPATALDARPTTD
jgi:hypothetical protein